MATTTYTITADSTPVYDEWGFGDYWGPEDWIAWHKKLKEKFGPDKANEIFIRAYHEAGLFASSYDWRSFNSGFKKYAKENGFYDALYEGIGGLIGKASGVIVTGIQTTADTTEAVIENVGDAISNSTGMLKWLVPLIIIVVVVGAFMYFRKLKLA